MKIFAQSPLRKMNSQVNLFLYLFLTLFLFINSSLFGQSSGKMSGRVTDESNQPLIGATIVVDGTNLGGVTDLDGYYSIINIRAGSYTIKFRYVGYQTNVVGDVRITSDQTKTLNSKLIPEAVVGQEIVIVDKRPMVEFNQTSSVSSISADDIKSLPLQNLSEIVNLQAGVVDGHFRGGRIGEVQYQVDGVTVNNPFNNSSSMELDRSILEEVQVISGTFDAKYGQAMSGVVNAVLKTGGNTFEVSGEAYSGDYYTTDTKRYPNNNNYSPATIQNYQLTISGPTYLPQTTFFVSGRRYRSDGYLYGTRRFNPTDKSDLEKSNFYPTGDNATVAMNTTSEWSGQFKITNQSIKDIQVSYQATYNNALRKGYNYAFRLNPDGVNTGKTTSLTHGVSFTHTISSQMFYKINFRQNYFDYSDSHFEDLYDPQYLAAGAPKGSSNYEDGAIVQGIDLGRYKQKTNSYIAKGDFTWQFNRNNLFEAGVEGQYSEINFGSPGYLVSTFLNGTEILQPRDQFPRLPGVQNYFPRQFATYIQDRIELGDLVVRAGFRFEFFDARSFIPSDLQNPANTITGAPLSLPKSTTMKKALAPRLGLSFPLTTSASVYFSYGHFYQLPGLGLLYSNADYSLLDQLQAGGISYGVMGNPDLNPELTVQYEFGLKQSISDILGAQVSFFYKDIKDLLGVEFVSTYAAAEYARFTNVDFGSVYGFTVSLTQRNFGFLSTSLDYTMQFAQGNSSDPRESANRAAGGMDRRPRTVAFSWDQRNTLNASLVYYVPNDFSCSGIFRFGSGQPYTPEIGSGFGAALETNSGIKNSFALLDLRAEKYFSFSGLNFSVFARVFNVFNTSFVNGFVFSSTGSPDYTLTPQAMKSQLNDPSRFYEPRRIEFGVSFRSN